MDFTFTGRELVFMDAELMFTGGEHKFKGGEYKFSKGIKNFLIDWSILCFKLISNKLVWYQTVSYALVLLSYWLKSGLFG